MFIMIIPLLVFNFRLHFRFDFQFSFYCPPPAPPPVAQGEPEVPLVYALENLVGIDDEVAEDAVEAVEG